MRKTAEMKASFDSWLSRTWPAAFVVYKRVENGSKACVQDLKAFYYIRKDLRQGRKPSDFDKKDLQLYMTLPRELVKLVTIFVLLEIPIVGECLILLALVFPRFLLTSHFWTAEQRRKFGAAAQEAKVRNLFPALRMDMEGANLSQTSELEALGHGHKFRLLRLHHILPIPGAKFRLHRRLELMSALDKKLAGDVSQLEEEELRSQLHLRSLSAEGRDRDAQIALLSHWIRDSAKDASKPMLFAHQAVRMAK